jgi:hypothetical protein
MRIVTIARSALGAAHHDASNWRSHREYFLLFKVFLTFFSLHICPLPKPFQVPQKAVIKLMSFKPFQMSTVDAAK